MGNFKLKTTYKPAGDQPRAIEALAKGLKSGKQFQTLLGVTGSGKTFTVANVIQKIQKPTLVIAHNKTLAAQLAQEYREFFPENAVHYFVSYYDFYQPEAYLPVTDTYIEKEAQINEEIERLRHASTQALLTRNDTIVVASVSCIYGLGSPEEYQKVNIKLQRGQNLSRGDLIRALIGVHYTRTTADLSPGVFRALGNVVEVQPQSERIMYRIEFENELVGNIQKIDPISRKLLEESEIAFIFPARHFITPEDERRKAIETITLELREQLKRFEKEGKLLEAERLKRRTKYDLAMLREVGYCNGIENYSRHFSGKLPGEPPDTLLSYFLASARSDLSPDLRSDLNLPGFLTVI
ncbi:MAG: DEAD/DEAH box helicase family protein, partial [Patescibacteria group bacterium]